MTAMGKKNAFVTTIGFNKNDPAHVQVAELLNSMKRGKAQYIVNAVLAYQSGVQAGELPHARQAVDYGKIREFVLQVIEDHEQQGRDIEKTTGKATSANVKDEKQKMDFGFDEDALKGIISSLEAFKE